MIANLPSEWTNLLRDAKAVGAIGATLPRAPVGATTTPMVEVSNELVDAKIAAAEARTDSKFVQVLTRLDHIERSTTGLRTTVVTTAIAVALGLLGAMVGILAYGGQMFGIGLDAQTIANSAATSVEERMNERLLTLESQIGGIAAAIEARSPPVGPAAQN